MKLNVKKIYCASCRRLVKGNERTVNSHIQLSCPRCGSPIWVWNGVSWRYLVKNLQ